MTDSSTEATPIAPARREPSVGHSGACWEPGILQIITLVIWLSCLFIGLLGWLLSAPPPVPKAPAKPPEPPPMQAQVLNVQLDEPPPPPPDAAQPPPPADAAIPLVPDLPEVAAPSPAIAFAQPIEGAVQMVSGRFANPARAALARPQIRRLIYGHGEGRQPKPEYPFEAVAAHEEGSVGVRLSVSGEGAVLMAQLVNPSRWPLLNQAALAAVRRTWHFPGGAARVYDVVIQFHLNPT